MSEGMKEGREGQKKEGTEGNRERGTEAIQYSQRPSEYLTFRTYKMLKRLIFPHPCFCLHHMPPQHLSSTQSKNRPFKL